MNEDKLLKSLTSLYEDLIWLDGVLEFEEDSLNKAAHYWKNKNPKKYAQMLKKLKHDRKKVGNKEEAAQKVQQARRRERGGSGTTAGQHGRHGHKSGHDKSSTASAVKKLQNAQKKSGQRLSLDRQNNDKGYESGNVKMVPDKLNRGDENNKKKKAWYKKHKK